MTSRSRALVAIALLTLLADQGTKLLAATDLAPIAERDVVEGYVRLRYAENPGAAWGLLSSLPDGVRRPALLVSSAIALAFLAFMWWRVAGARRLGLAVSLMMGGAAGNFLDRLLRGHVIDFIDLHWRNHPALRWPTFNVADVAICVGLALVLRETLRQPALEPAAGAFPAGGVPNS